MTQPAIQVANVCKRFRKGELEDSLRDLVPALLKRALGRTPKASIQDFWALREVSFNVEKGQSLGIIGPNGAGKSTLLKLLSRIIQPNLGRITVHGRLSALIEIGSGFHPDLTGRENIYLNGAILGMKKREIRAKEEQIVEFSGVREFLDTPVKRYSSGMKARLGFSVAAHMEPEILLVDEVLSVGDARFRAKCIHHMHNLINSDVTVLFISHILDQVRSLCPNTIVLDRGQTVYQGPTEGAIRKYLELLSDAPGTNGDDLAAAALVRNVVFRDAAGKEVLQWQARQPAVVECDLLLRRPLDNPALFINFASIGGMYLGTAATCRQGLQLPAAPGTYTLRFTLDPMPLSDGDYSLEFKIHDGPEYHQCVWSSPQPRTISIRGTGLVGVVIPCDGRWELLPNPNPTPPEAAIQNPG